MEYIEDEDLKGASLSELAEWEREWRETVERELGDLAECESLPMPEDLDAMDDEEAIGLIDHYVESGQEFANNWIADLIEWGKVAEARVKAQAKAKKKAAKAA